MTFNWFENTSDGTKFVLSVALMIGFMAIGLILSIVFAWPFYPENIADLIEGNANIPISLLKFMQAFQSTFLFVLPPIILSILFGLKPSKALYLNVKPKFNHLFISIGLVLVAIPFINYTQMINSKLDLPDFMCGIENWLKNTENAANQLTEKFLTTSSFAGLMVNILVMAIIPAIGEELTFRGLFQQIFTNWTKNYHCGIILSAIFFSAFHIQFYGFIPRFLLGVAFGYLFVWSGSIWIPIAGHFFNNFIGIVAYYLFNQGIIDKQFDTIGTEGDILIFLIVNSILLTFVLMVWGYQTRTVRKNN